MSASQRRSVSRIWASMRRSPRRACRSSHSERTNASKCAGRWRNAMARTPCEAASTSAFSSIRSASKMIGMSLPLPAIWVCKALMGICCA